MRTEFKLLIGLGIFISLALYWFLSGVQDAFSGSYVRIDLGSSGKEKLYIKKHNWGLTGDKQLTVIDSNEERVFEVDSTSQMVFHGLEPFLYRVSNDTLFLIVEKEGIVPDGFNSTWTIMQRIVDTPTMQKLRRDHELNGV